MIMSSRAPARRRAVCTGPFCRAREAPGSNLNASAHRRRGGEEGDRGGRNPRSMEIEVERTLVKSEPELLELIEGDPRLCSAGLRVQMAEKGFGTKVTITASPEAGMAIEVLDELLGQLAETRKRPI